MIEGHGPCNKQRMDHHLKYHDEGSWVREAAEAYKQKHTKKELETA